MADEFRKDIISLSVKLPELLYMIHTKRNDIPKLLHMLSMVKPELKVIWINFEDFGVTRLG